MHPIRYSKKEKRKIKEDFIIALGETLGIKGKAAKQCGVDVRTIDHWRQDDPDFDQRTSLSISRSRRSSNRSPKEIPRP